MRSSSRLVGIFVAALGGCFSDPPVIGETAEATSDQETTAACDQGSLGCACFPNGTCGVTLVCSAGTCKPFDPPPATSGSTSTSGSSTSSSDPTTLPGTTSLDGGSSESSASTGSEPAHILFTTSTSYTGGELGGLAGADALCTALGQGLREGPWVAVLRDVITSIGARVTVTGDVVNPLGELLATDEAELLSGTLQNLPGYDENGAPISGSDLAWTGSTEHDCIGWTVDDSMFMGATGLPTDPTLWLGTGSPLPCHVAPHLYCLSQ